MEESSSQDFLMLTDLIPINPTRFPFVIIGQYYSFKHGQPYKRGYKSEFMGIRSILVPLNQKEIALEKLDYTDIIDLGMGGYFRGKNYKVYALGETIEFNKDLTLERIYWYRSFEGLEIDFFEPIERLVLYLNLVREENSWIDPHTKEVIIKISENVEKNENWIKEDMKIEVKIDYLRDYLAARQMGLLITRYCERIVVFIDESEIPFKRGHRQIENGTWSFYPIIDKGISENPYCMAEIRQKFWLDPLPQPRRWDYGPPSEFTTGIEFTLKDGNRRTYNKEKDYFELISFHPSVLVKFRDIENYDIIEYSRTTFGLKFPDGSILHASVNAAGQVQAWWGTIAKLDAEKQRYLASYSEPWKAKIDPEYFRVTVEAEPPRTKPLKGALQKLKDSINSYWSNKFNETFFNPKSTIKDLRHVYEPYTGNLHGLVDVMEELDKWLLAEGTFTKIKEHYSLGSEIENPKEIEKFGSIATMKLILRKFFGESVSDEIMKPIYAMREFRTHKAHYTENRINKTLSKFGYTNMSPREIYLDIMNRLLTSLEFFRQRSQNGTFQ